MPAKKAKPFLPLLALALYALAASLGAFTGGLWGALGIGGALALFTGVWIADGKPPWPPQFLLLLAVLVLTVFGIESFFSFAPAVSAKAWMQLVTIFLPLLLLTAPALQAKIATPFFAPVVALAMFLGASFLWLELVNGGPLLHALKPPNIGLTQYNRGMAHLAILAFPVFAALWLAGGKKSALALALLMLLPAQATESHTAKLALILGSLCALLACYKPAWVQKGIGAALLLMTGWPFYARLLFTEAHEKVQDMHPSFLHRLEIWDYLSYRIAEHPLFGNGLGVTHLLDVTQPHGALYRFATGPAPHAHNFVVQLWVETGFCGVALAGLFLFAVLRRIGRLHDSLRPYALGGFTAALTVACFGFDFWTDALWAAFALTACAFGMLQQSLQRGVDLRHG